MDCKKFEDVVINGDEKEEKNRNKQEDNEKKQEIV